MPAHSVNTRPLKVGDRVYVQYRFQKNVAPATGTVTDILNDRPIGGEPVTTVVRDGENLERHYCSDEITLIGAGLPGKDADAQGPEPEYQSEYNEGDRVVVSNYDDDDLHPQVDGATGTVMFQTTTYVNVELDDAYLPNSMLFLPSEIEAYVDPDPTRNINVVLTEGQLRALQLPLRPTAGTSTSEQALALTELVLQVRAATPASVTR